MAPFIIGISGVAGAGKDTMYKILKEHILPTISVERVAFADELKKEINPFLLSKFKISAFTSDRDKKDIIRPLLVAYGKAQRTITQGRYWIEKIQTSINDYYFNDILPVITDVRYDEHDNDEADFILKENNGILIHITRKLNDGRLLKPANTEEEINNPKVKAKATLQITWPSLSINELIEWIKKNKIDNKIKSLINAKYKLSP